MLLVISWRKVAHQEGAHIMPVAHNVVRILGTLPGGEVWSVNPRFTSGTGPLLTDYDDLAAWAEAIALLNSGTSLPVDLRGVMGTAVGWYGIRTEYRDGTGALGMAAEYIYSTPQGGQNQATKPFQTSLVSSLLTGRPGRSYRGRLYWPTLAITIQPLDLRVNAGLMAPITAAITSWLSAVQDATINGDDGLRLAVVSEKLSVATPVTSIECGNVLDVQRRRRDSLVEARTSYNYPITGT